MPKPSTVEDLLGLIRRSRLVDESKLARFLHTMNLGGPAEPTPDVILSRLVGEALLTRFQADLLAAGRWRGFVIGNYRLRDKLGSGGMGTVYLAEPIVPSQGGPPRVAVKVLDSRLSSDPVARERFAREAWAAARLAHPNIVTVFAIQSDSEPIHLVMEYVEGVTLQAAVARAGTFAAGTAAHCGRQVALGLQRAYEVGLVHRDIKPANLLIDCTGTVKILDLGIVRVPGAGDLTQRGDTNTVLGTADYLAPEQAVNSSDVDSRADIYSLGSTLYFLLAGHPPFPDGTADQKLVRKQSEVPPSIDRLRPDVAPGLAAVIQKMLACDADDRYPTPLAVANALAPWAEAEPGFPAGLLAAARATVADEQGAITPVDPRPHVPLSGAATAQMAPTALTARLPATREGSPTPPISELPTVPQLPGALPDPPTVPLLRPPLLAEAPAGLGMVPMPREEKLWEPCLVPPSRRIGRRAAVLIVIVAAIAVAAVSLMLGSSWWKRRGDPRSKADATRVARVSS